MRSRPRSKKHTPTIEERDFLTSLIEHGAPEKGPFAQFVLYKVGLVRYAQDGEYVPT
jgi:hypothetical protein